MVMSERKHYVIPFISSLNLLPNIVDLQQLEETTDPNIIDSREVYVKIILLLLYMYLIQDGLELNCSC